jgi:3-oxoacyl-[acyl-carrier protein] reductase
VDYYDTAGLKKKTDAFFAERPIDILVNNTNGPAAGTVLEKNLEDYQAAFDLLFKSYHRMAHLALDGMKKRGYGRIINVSSISVKEPIRDLVLSNTIRTAVVSWAKCLAREVAPFGITVNSVLTGSFDTERIEEVMEVQSKSSGVSMDDLRKQKNERIPAGRLGKPEEYGYLVAFLASPFAGYINGANIPIDGGYLRSISYKRVYQWKTLFL